jgi:hypothetical protein
MFAYTRFTLIVLLASLLGLSACGKNPHIVDQPPREVDGTDPIQDPDPEDPIDPPPPPPPGVHMVNLAARDYPVEELQAQALSLPYRVKKVKTITFGKSQRGLMCRFFGSDNCTRNRQVLFAFDLPKITDIKKLHDVRLQANFVTYGKSYDTELLCLNNIKACSGNGIQKIPVLGMSKYVKKKWWDADYWAGGYDDVVRNKHFQESVKSSTPVNDSTRVSGQRDFSIRELFNLTDQELIALIEGEKTLWFTLTDDTFIMSPTLVVMYE